MNDMTYISVLSTEKYFVAIQSLYKSLVKTKTKYQFTVLINDNISKETEKKIIDLGANVIRKTSIKISEEVIKSNNNNNAEYWNNTFDKLQIFELTQYKKIVYLDADMYIRKNIDELFEKENMSAVIDKRYIPTISENWIKLNSGIMVIEPCENIISKFIETLKNMDKSKKTFGDQDILQDYDKSWNKKENLHLNNRYNVFFPFLDYYINKDLIKIDDIAVIHFVFEEKPWNYDGENKIKNYLNAINSNLLETAKKRNLDVLKECVEIGSCYRSKILEEYYKL